MALRFEQDQGGPAGMGMFIDDESGMRRRAYDPGLAESLAAGIAPTPDQQMVVDNAATVPVQAAAAPTQLDPNAQRPATALPGGNPAPIASALPSVSGDRAQAWEAAQAPPMPPVVRASGAPPPPPAAPSGTQLSKASLEPGVPGHTYDKGAEEARGEDLLDRTTELQRRDDATTALFNEQKIELDRQRQEDEKRLEEEREKGSRYERELQDTVAKEINPDRIRENTPLMGSILGLVGQTLAYMVTQDPQTFARADQALARRIEADITQQREDKNSKISLLTKQLGNAQQAESHYRASVRTLYADTLENKMKRMGVSDQYGDQIQKLRDGVTADNEAARVASYGKPGSAKYEFERPKPVAGAKAAFTPGDSESRELEGLLGPKWETNYEKGMAAKVQAGENGATVAQAMPMIAEMDGDVATLKALAQANGGTIPTKGVLNVPKVLVGPLSKMGYQPGQRAEEANQLVTGYVLRKARSYGGAVTAPDYENAEKEFGASGDGLLRGVQRMRDAANNGVRSAIATHFRGNAQQVYDITRRSYGKTSGTESKAPIPFEVQGAEPIEQPVEAPKPKKKGQRGLGRYGFMGDE